MYAYPTNVVEEAAVLFSALQNPQVLADAKHRQAAWAVVGYGLSLFDGGVHPLMHNTRSVEDVLVEKLDKVVNEKGVRGVGEVEGVEGAEEEKGNWVSIALLVIELLNKFLIK